jgi:metal-responsive CopG/Arc/MetJ family transcriptional regulator
MLDRIDKAVERGTAVTRSEAIRSLIAAGLRAEESR